MIVFQKTNLQGGILIRSAFILSMLTTCAWGSASAGGSSQLDDDVARFAHYVRDWRSEYGAFSSSKGYSDLRNQMTIAIKSFGIQAADDSSISQLMNALLISRAQLKTKVRELTERISECMSVTSTDDEDTPSREEGARFRAGEEDVHFLEKVGRKIVGFKSSGARAAAMASPERGAAQFARALGEQERLLREQHAKDIEDMRSEFAAQRADYQRRIDALERQLAETSRLLAGVDVSASASRAALPPTGDAAAGSPKSYRGLAAADSHVTSEIADEDDKRTRLLAGAGSGRAMDGRKPPKKKGCCGIC